MKSGGRWGGGDYIRLEAYPPDISRYFRALRQLLVLISIAYNVTMEIREDLERSHTADLKFIFSLLKIILFKTTLWLIEIDLRKWDKRG